MQSADNWVTLIKTRPNHQVAYPTLETVDYHFSKILTQRLHKHKHKHSPITAKTCTEDRSLKTGHDYLLKRARTCQKQVITREWRGHKQNMTRTKHDANEKWTLFKRMQVNIRCTSLIKNCIWGKHYRNPSNSIHTQMCRQTKYECKNVQSH